MWSIVYTQAGPDFKALVILTRRVPDYVKSMLELVSFDAVTLQPPYSFEKNGDAKQHLKRKGYKQSPDAPDIWYRPLRPRNFGTTKRSER